MIIKASYHQERLWFIDQFESGKLYESSPTYHNIPFILDIDGTLNVDFLERSIRTVIDRHSVLRTRIVTVKNEPFQQVDRDLEFKLQQIDWRKGSDKNADEPFANAVNAALRYAHRPFSLDKDLLVRGALIRIHDDKHLLVMVFHHIIVDKYSLEIFAGELVLHYEAYLNNNHPRLPEVILNYVDFSQWQRELPDSILDTLLSYWKRKLKGKLQVLELPGDFPRNPIHIYEAATHSFHFSRDLGEKIKALAKQEKISHFVLFLTAFKVLLHRYSGQDEIILGTGVNNRNQPGTEEIVGPIANLLPLRSILSGTSSFKELLPGLSKTVDDAYKYQEMPYDKLVLELKPDKDMSRTALFDVVFQYEENPLQISPGGSLGIRCIETNLGWGKYDLNVLIRANQDSGESFSGILVYNKKYYSMSTISHLTAHYKVLLESIFQDPFQEISKLSLLTEKERQQLLIDWNRSEAGYPGHKTIQQLFEEQVEKYPAHIAVVHQDIYLTYGQLNRRANQLAHYLRAHYNIRPDTIVGLMAERSPEMIIGILAVLKAGGSYMPIDGRYPENRIKLMLADCSIPVLLTDNRAAANHSFTAPQDMPLQRREFAGDILKLDQLEEVWNNGADTGPEPVNQPDDAAYIIFTSGSTGQPKGTVISHRNVVRLLENDKRPFDFYPHDVWIMAHSVCFDFSVWEMYGALFNGGKLIVPTLDTVRDTGEFLLHIKKHCISVLNQTPGAFYNLIARERMVKEKTLDKHLRWVIFGGDRLQPYYLKEWTDFYPLTAVRLINMYGITETTVHVTFHPLREDEINADNQSSPIGGPLPETTLYVLDEHLNLQPIGIPGEICVGGTGLARGYLNRSVETRERFIRHPFKRNRLLYRSGDLGKRLADGNILYLGRIDHQVKIRGFRVELGEIETQLLTHDQIREAVVIDREESGGDKYICAYIVTRPGISLPVPELREYLARCLPDYMIPAYFVELKEIPLTGNGKIDRRSLPQPQIKAGEEYSGPVNEIEKKLVDIYSRVLNLDDGIIGVNSDFFEYGGHSVKAMNLIARIHKELKVKVPISELFIRTTVRKLSGYIENAVEEKFSSIAAVEEKEYYVLSSAQKRMYIIQQIDLANTSYNIPIIEALDFHIDKNRFEEAAKKLVARHESLRTSFALVREVPYQRVHDSASLDFSVSYFQVPERDNDDKVKRITDDFVKPFDLRRAPLFRMGLINTGENRNILMLNMHHIISDGISMDIIVEDFLTLYPGLEPPALLLQYKDYAEWQNSEEQRRLLKKQEEYWLTVFAGELPVLDLPFDYERPEVKRFQGKLVYFKLGEEESEALRDLAASRNATLYMVLLTVVNILLARLCHQQDIIVGTYTFGRGHADLRQILGMFVNTLAMRNFPHLEKHVDDFLEEVKKNTLDAFENQDYQFDDLVELVAGERSKDRNPIFDVCFGLQNQSDYTAGSSEQGFRYEYKATHFDMVLMGVEAGQELGFNLEYDTQLFKRETIGRIIDDFLQIVRSIIDDSHMKIKDIQLESELLPLKKVNLDVEFSI